MPRQSKTRVRVEANGFTTELFSIMALKTGDLLLIQKGVAGIGDVPGVETQTVREVRTTIHVSPNSPGHTINSHFFLQNGDEHLRTAIIFRHEGKLLWPIIGERMCGVGSDGPNLRHRPSDTIVNLPSFDQKRSSLAWIAVLTDSPPNLPMRNGMLFGGHAILFHSFTIIVFFSYMWAPVNERGHSITYETTAPRLNRINVGSPRFATGISFSDKHLSEVLVDTLHRFSQGYEKQLLLSDMKGEELQALTDLSLTYSSRPAPEPDQLLSQIASSPPIILPADYQPRHLPIMV